MSMYPFIEAEKAGERSVNRACAVLKVSRAAYYEWRRQQPSRRAQEDRELTEKVRAIFEGSRQTYGAPRVHQTLRQAGTRCSRKPVARLMSEQQLQGPAPPALEADDGGRSGGDDRRRGPDRAAVPAR